ncbi:protein shifted [Egretta garzetta]|uniref:protein shifted n=1 Tax=Egretta garzetta TaxID=188379 RepID=UPI00051EE788|nr:protein shifted [Egretta garzetta]
MRKQARSFSGEGPKVSLVLSVQKLKMVECSLCRETISPDGQATCYPKCKNGGECLRPGKCRCPPGYGGRYCHKVSCEGGCQNGGECISVNGVVKCLCASGWTGSRCQEAICPQGCRNNGACVAPGICSCPAGWVGGACHLAVCKLPCQHGGKCIAPNVCRCRLPYSGLQCTKKRKE